MDNEKELPRRKTTRLKDFDYSSEGAYFITMCTENRVHLLSEIVKENIIPIAETNDSMVGEGLAPPEITIKLKPCGEIVKEQLRLLENRFPNVTVGDYVIMPNHVHAIIFLGEKAGGGGPSPTLSDIVCVLKSLTSRICKQRYGIERLFQRSYSEHIIRDMDDYRTRRKYIFENPKRWYYKYLDSSE